jgi:hypothetical protein
MTANRRAWLKGVTLGGSASVLGPVVGQLQAHAAGATPTAKRIVFVVEGNGVQPDQIQPVGITRKRDAQNRGAAASVIEHALADKTLPFALEPIAHLKNRTTIVQGLSGRVCGGGHSNNFGALGVYSSKAGTAGETIDAALAAALPSIFPHVGLGISDRVEHSVIYNVSALAAGKALPTQCQPHLAYTTLFGSVADGAGKAAFAAQNNLLDFMIDDVKRLEKDLAGPEREKLQSYLQSFEAMRARQSQLKDVEATLKTKGPKVTDKFQSAVETDRLEAQFDIAAATLICGLTNVVTISSGAGDPFFSVRFRGLGIDLDKHSIGHGRGVNNKTAAELSATIRRFHFQQIAKLADQLKAVPEGNGTMLDNTAIIYLSDAAEGHHSRCYDWPMVVIGNLGGALKTQGRYLEFPKYGSAGHRTTANFYLALLHAVGKPRVTFGQEDITLKGIDTKGPLQEILA